MHTHVVVGAFFALALCLIVIASMALVVHVAGRRYVDYLLFSAGAGLTAVYSAALGLAYWYGAQGSIEQWDQSIRVVRAAACIGLPAIVHFAVRHLQLRVHRNVLLLTYVIASATALLVILSPSQSAAIHLDHVVVFGLHIDRMTGHSGSAMIAVALIAAVAQTCICAVSARSWLRGRRESLPLLAGVTVLSLSVVNDLLVSNGQIRTVHVVPVGFLGFGLAVGASFVVQYAALRNELAHRARELRTRTTELVRSRKELNMVQTELGRKQQLAAVGEMAAVIAHEVRNPLAVISNAVASLRREGLGRHDHETLLGILDEENSRLNRLVTDLLAYARPIALQRQRVVLQELVQRSRMLVADRAHTKVVIDADSANAQVGGDPNLLRQVFDNLIENAAQAMGQGGIVTVSIVPETRDGIEGYSVRIRDEGEGMDTQVRTRAMDPFFTTRPAGTGLGLAIVNRIVEAHAGEVQIKSKAGEGTTVTVFLPIGMDSLLPSEPRVGSVPPPDRPPSPVIADS